MTASAASTLAAAGLLVLAAIALPSATGWVGETPDTHHATLAVLAAERLPQEHRDLLLAHREAFERGAWEPDADVHTFWHTYEVDDGGGGAVWQIEEAVYEAAMAIRENRSAEEIAYRMGYITHFSLDLSVPFHTGEDLYDHALHLQYEHNAERHHDELRLNETSPPPREVEDVRAAATALAARSAAEAPGLLRALESTERVWSPEAAEITARLIDTGLDTTADLLLTAFLRGDPSRPAPEPTHRAYVPTVGDPQDVGLGDNDIRRAFSWQGAAVVAAGIVATAGAAAAAAWAYARRQRTG